MSISGEEEEEEGVAAGLSAMEAEFREIDENGSWSAIYQVGPNQGGNGLPLAGQVVANAKRLCSSFATISVVIQPLG